MQRTPARLLVAVLCLVGGLLLAQVALGTHDQYEPTFSLHFSGPEEVVIPLERWGLTHVPDGPISYLRADGQLHVWLTARQETYYLRGTGFDNLVPHPLDGAGNAVPVLGPSGSGFDRHYAGAGAVFRAATGSDLIMFYHAEDQTYGGACPYVSIALARSADGGVTWAREGQIITSPELPGPCDPLAPRFKGAGSFDVVPGPDGYYYLYYTEWHAGIPDGIRLARASIAGDGAPHSWQKYKDGAFSEPGLGGASDLLIDPRDVADEFLSIPSISYNTALEQYLGVFVGKYGFYVGSSPDLLTWTTPTRFWTTLTLPPADEGQTWHYYPSLLSPAEATDTRTTATAYLYYARGVRDGPAHFMLRRPVTIGNLVFLPLVSGGGPVAPPGTSVPTVTPSPSPTPAPPAGVTLVSGSQFEPPAPWTWLCRGDFTVTYPNGMTSTLHDEHPDTGLVLRLDPVSQLRVNAPSGGYCAPFDASGVVQGQADFVTYLQGSGCDSDGCYAVNIKRLGPTGVLLADEWVPAVPPGVELPAGGTFTPQPFWTWVCSGDLSITRPDGVTVNLYDESSTSGLLLQLRPDSQLRVNAPWRGSCTPFYAHDVASGVEHQVAAAFSTGCGGGGCATLNVKVLSPVGTILQDDWLP